MDKYYLDKMIEDVFVEHERTIVHQYFADPSVEKEEKDLLVDFLKEVRVQAFERKYDNGFLRLFMPKYVKQEMEEVMGTRMSKLKEGMEASKRIRGTSSAEEGDISVSHKQVDLEVEEENMSSGGGEQSQEPEPEPMHVEEQPVHQHFPPPPEVVVEEEEAEYYPPPPELSEPEPEYEPEVEHEEEEEQEENDGGMMQRSISRIVGDYGGEGGGMAVSRGSQVIVLTKQDGWAWVDKDGQQGYVPESMLEE
eukprot:TRINITY_DN1868_c3_g2_i2.p3 TRINITY_DN1868_c3_g2~~TRINITY_DN1868_c3_g2_i2.p3  ORF type:complete len:251 (-),score=100.45 TRINITY_DN1868_c3_g2_i2:1404-2156(-)